MDRPRLIMASASPRRRRLIEYYGVPVVVAETGVDEDLAGPLRSLPPVLARSIAADKARAARADAADAVILAFDTIVVVDRKVLGKPANREEARAMLEALSGRTHDVITGVAVFLPSEDEPRTFAVTTPVTMHDLPADQLQEWLDSDEVLGCAGAYNIERHLAFVEDGECYQNVAGLPLCHLYRELARLGVGGLQPPNAACDAARGTCCELGARISGRAGHDAPPPSG